MPGFYAGVPVWVGSNILLLYDSSRSCFYLLSLSSSHLHQGLLHLLETMQFPCKLSSLFFLAFIISSTLQLTWLCKDLVSFYTNQYPFSQFPLMWAFILWIPLLVDLLSHSVVLNLFLSSTEAKYTFIIKKAWILNPDIILSLTVDAF